MAPIQKWCIVPKKFKLKPHNNLSRVLQAVLSNLRTIVGAILVLVTNNVRRLRTDNGEQNQKEEIFI